MAKALKTGGWQDTKFIEWYECKAVMRFVQLARINAHVTIMPEYRDSHKNKKCIQKITSRIGQAIKRRGRAHIGLTTFEKGGKRDADLHGHHIMRVPYRDRDILERLESLEFNGTIEVSWRTTHSGRHEAATYITKQRKGNSKKIEARISRYNHRYEENVQSVPGKKISLTKAAQPLYDELIAEELALKADNKIRYAKPVAVAQPQQNIKPSGQLFMFPELEHPPVRLKDFHGGILSPSQALELEYKRKRRGLTQHQLGHLAGLSQPQLANVIHGRYGMSHQAAERLHGVLAA